MFTFIERKKAKQLSNEKSKHDAEVAFINFRLMTQKERIKLVQSILDFDSKTTIENDYLSYEENGTNTLTIISVEHEKFDNDCLFNVLSKIETNYEKLNIICGENLVVDMILLSNVTINIIDKYNLYKNYFLPKNIYPPINKIKPYKFSWKKLLTSFVSKDKSKNYFLCGLFLIFSAIILPYMIYYLIFGSAFLILALVSKVFGKT